MAFSLSGTTITQSGTDTDLSGLSGIAGVTTTPLTGDASVTWYNLGDLRLDVSGDLTIDSWAEKFMGGSTAISIMINVVSGGSLTVTGSGEFITDTSEATDFAADGPLHVANGGSLDLSDCTIATTRNCDFNQNSATGSITLRGTKFRKITSDATQVVRLDFTSADGVSDLNISLDAMGVLITSVGSFSGIELRNGGSIDSNNTLSAEGGGQSEYGLGNRNATFSNLKFAGNIGFYSLKLRNRNTMTIRNFDTPLDEIGITGRLALSDKGIVFFERNLSFKITDGSGSVQGAIVKITDNRVATDTLTTPVTYTFTSTVDGTTNQENVLLGVGSSLSATTQADHDVRESYGDDDDMNVRMTANIASYNHNLATTPVGLVGLGDLEFSPAPLGIDSLITETDKSITNAYTTLETPQQFYDRAKAYLVDNYAGETSTIVTRSGDTIDVGSYDVEFASGGSSAFEFDGTTITVRCGTSFTGNITTTGTVSFSGSASVDGIISDSNGTTGILELL